ncbi:MAG: hypothetical protein ACO23H_08340 [Alphaproteobacteria bacterium]
MSEFDKFLEENSIEVPEDPVVEDPPEDEETGESEFDRFIREYNEKAEADGLTPIDMSKNVSDTMSDKVEPLPGTGDLVIDVTDEVKASQEASQVRDYDYFYGQEPEAPPLSTRVEAFANSIYNFVTQKEGESTAQKAVNAYNESAAKFEKQAQEFYDKAPEMTLPDVKALGINLPDLMMDNELSTDRKVKVSKRLTRGENGLEVSYVLIPKPGSKGWQRIIDQAGRTIAQETLGLFEFNGEEQADFLGIDVNLGEDSELAKSVPDFEQEGVEGLVTDILSFGLPTMAAERIGRGTAKTVLKPIDRAIDKVGGKFNRYGGMATDGLAYTGGAVATALTENLMSQEGDVGAIFTPQSLKEVFPEMSDEELSEVALLTDGLVLNGVIDAFLGFGGRVAGFIGDKTRGAKGLIDPTFVRNESRKAALIGTATILDPRLAGADRRTIAEGLRNLSMVLDENSTRLIKIGESEGEVPVDTVNALLDGAKKYIETTYQNLPPEVVEQEAREMIDRAISLTRSQEGVEAIRQRQTDMLSGVNEVISDEINRVNPDGVTMGEASASLVDQYQGDVLRRSDELEVAEATKSMFERQLENVVQDDPYIADLIKDNDPTAFFDDEKLVGRVTEMFGEEFRDTYRQAYDAVKESYEAIPNTPIGEEAATVFRDALQDAFRAMGPLDQSGDKAQSLLAAVDKVFKPKKIGEQMDDLGLGVDPRDPITKTDIMQSPDEMIASLGEDIGFGDLFRLKKELATLIKDTDDSAVRNRLIYLRNTITSAARTEDGEAVGILAHIIDQGGDTAQKAKEADELFIATQSRFNDTASTQRLSETANETAYQGAATPVPTGGTRRGQKQFESTAVNEVLPNMMADRTGNQFDSFVFAMDAALSRGDVSKPIADLYIAQGTYDLADAIRRGDEQGVDMIKRTFESHITALKQLDDPIVGNLEEAMRRISDTQGELGDRILQADKLIEYATKAKVDAENSIVKDLISKRTGGAKSGTDITLSNMLRGDDAANNILSLMEEANRLPEGTREATVAAIQSSLLRNLQDSIFTSTAIGLTADGVQTDAALGSIKTLLNERKSGAISAIAAAFPNDEIMQETMTTALEAMVDFNIGARMKVARAGSPTAANASIRDSVSTAILFTFGYMNPTAAAARRITAGQIDAMERLSEDEQRKILGSIMADPEAFAEIARGVANNVDPSKLKILKDTFFEASRRYAQYEMRVGPQEDETDEQTESFFGKAADYMQDAYNFATSPFR